jgi:hypothetical protein
VRGKVKEEFVERLAEGRFRSAREAQAFVRKEMSESGVRQMLCRLGGRLKAPRKSHVKKDQAKANRVQSGAARPPGQADRSGSARESVRLGPRRAPFKAYPNNNSIDFCKKRAI